MGRGADKFGNRTERAFRRASKSASRFKSITGGILKAQVITRGFALMTQGVRSLTDQFIDFDLAITGATVRFGDIGPRAKDFTKQMKILRGVARDAGATTEFTAAQAAEALNFLAKAGFTSVEAIGSLNTMINLATASGEDFSRVADISSDLLGAFGLNVDDAAQKIKNLTRLNDVLVVAVNSANVTIEDMFETMKIVAPVATKMGQSLEDVTAITAFLGSAGIKGSQAATAMKNAILRLVAPSTTAAKMISALGVKIDDGTGNMRKLNDIMADLAPELKKLGNLKAGKILDEIFGKRAIAGAINIADGTDAIIKLTGRLKDAGATAQLTADIMRRALGNQIKTLISAATEFGFKVFEAFEIRGKKGIEGFIEAVRGFDPQPVIKAIEATIRIGKGLFIIFKPLIPVIKLVADILGFIAEKIIALEGSTKFFEAAFKGFQRLRGFVGRTFLSGEDILPKITGFASRNVARSATKEVVPPNREEAAARRDIGFQGRLDIAGAPEGSTVKSKTTGAAPIDVNLLEPSGAF
jgi:TP901 family phage tail tape measure protein